MVDVLVPVYRNPGLVERCLDSVFRCTDGPFRLVVIDDASPEPEMAPVLSRAARDPRCVLFRNPANRGFVGTVNRFLRMTRNDVVLLNSDTVVTPGWLGKMRRAAGPGVASVTPLTNNGTICAVPDWNEDNEVPEGWTIESFGQMVESVSEGRIPDIPTAVGFCMWMSRRAIDAVGGFDEVTFDRGYGEENDWCLRASALGFRHVLDDRTWVHHAGGASFGEGARALYEANYRRLCEKHPHYHGMIQDFIARNPLAAIQEAVRDGIARRGRRLRVLIVLHSPLEVAGGTEAHTRDLLRSVPGVDFRLAVPDAADGWIVTRYRDGSIVDSATLSSSALETWVEERRADVVHVQHMLDRDVRLVSRAHAAGVPVLWAWHDYYLACSSYKLLDEDDRFCGWSTDLARCDRCLAGREKLPAGFQRAWRRFGATVAGKISLHLFPSAAARDGAARMLPIPPERTVVLPHGRDLYGAFDAGRPGDGRLRVAFLGAWAREKGARTFGEAVSLSDPEKIEFHAFGGVAPRDADSLPPSVRHHGAYDGEKIVSLLAEHRIDVVVLPASWPETYSYTLSEAWKAGAAVVGSELGAIGERIRAQGAGWTVPPGDAAAIARTLERISRGPEELRERRERARAWRGKPLAEMGLEYARIYRRLAAARAWQ